MNDRRDINFITIADSKFFEPAFLSAEQVLKFYPNSKLYIYDWGFTETQRRKLENMQHITVLPWQMKFIPIEIKLGRMFGLKKLLGIYRWRDLLHNILFARQEIFNFKTVLKIPVSEMRFFNKFLCIKHFNDTFKENFIFIDADAFLINPIDELLDDSFDLGVTIRRKTELSLSYNNCTVLNVGMLFFFGGYEKNKTIIDAWRDELDITNEVSCEQTALTRLLYKAEPDIYNDQNRTWKIRFESCVVRIKILPCEIYNYNWVEEFDPERDKNKVKILHFKSGRFNTPIFKKISEELNL
jgi:hypothetical protein